MPGTIFLAKVPFIVFIIYTVTHKGLVWRIVTPNTDANYNRGTNKDNFNHSPRALDRGWAPACPASPVRGFSLPHKQSE